MEKISLEQIPAVIMEMKEQLQRIEGSLAQLGNQRSVENGLFTVSEAAKFLTLAESTLYSKVCRFEIPVIKKGKRLYFEKDALLKWLQEGRRKTVSDFQDKVEEYAGRFRKF